MNDEQHASVEHYDPIAQSLHWLVFILLAIEFIVAGIMPGIRRGAEPGMLVSIHFSFGLLILATIVVRIIWRAVHRFPEQGSTVPSWDAVLARLMQYALYLVLIALPFAGWIWASSRGWTITFFGLFPVPPLVAVGAPIGKIASDAHSVLAGLLALLIVIHGAAALYHHYMLKDDVLKRMLPKRMRTPQQ